MLTLIWVIAAGLMLLGISELVRKRLKISNEDSRKTYHLIHALIIGAAPFLVSYWIIIALELVLLVIMFAVRRFKLLPWLYKVGRLSWGEYFGVAAVIVIALMKPNKWVFLAAILHLGIADALAAVIGKRYGKKYEYHVFGQRKSLPGSLTFYLASIALTALVLVATESTGNMAGLLIILPLFTTAAEAASPYGLDNLVIPVLVTLVLGTLQFAPA